MPTHCEGSLLGKGGAVPDHPLGGGEGVPGGCQHVTGQQPLHCGEGQVQHPHPGWPCAAPNLHQTPSFTFICSFSF